MISSSPRSKRRAANKRNNNNKSKRNKTGMTVPMDVDNTSNGGAATTTTTATLLDLHRLLHVMETDQTGGGDKTARDLLLRADLLRTQYQAVAAADAAANANGDSALAGRVEAAYQAAQRAAAALQPQQPPTSTTAQVDDNDPVQKIFFPKTGTASMPSTEEAAAAAAAAATVNGEDSHSQKDSKPAAKAVVSSPPAASESAKKTAPNIQDLQQQQREQMEEAVAAMAQQMKHQTAQIHQQLQQQTVTLDVLEDVATQNVESVTDVAQRTQRHNSTSWGKTLGKWTLFITVLAAFFASLLTISMVPKRPNACLFFCKSQQQFCRTINGKQECLDGATSTPTTKVGNPTPAKDDTVVAESEVEKVASVVQQDTAEETTELAQDGESVTETKEQEQVPPYEDPAYLDAVRAATAGAFKELRQILKERPDLVDLQDANGWTLLMEASRNGRTEVIRVLMRHKANALAETFTAARQSALSLAREALGDQHLVVGILEQYVAEQRAAMGEEEPPTVTHDCEAAADGECVTVSTETTASEDHQHASQVPPPAEEMRREALREYELQHQQYEQQQQQQQQKHDTEMPPPPRQDGAENSMPTGARTAKLDFTAWDVRDAAQRGDYEQLALYVDQEPAATLLDEGDVNGWNALHLATRAGRADIVELLLEAGVSAHQETNSGRKALDLALLEFGEDHPLTKLLAGA